MFRLSHYLRTVLKPGQSAHAAGPKGNAPPLRMTGPVVIWNLIRRCNLTCMHCYSISGDVDFPGELSTAQVFETLDDLKAFGVPVLILSGGEPLLRRDIFEISKRAKALGFFLCLSTNGTLIDAWMADRIAEADYDYVGISIDGLKETHDVVRRKAGAFDQSVEALRLLRDRGVKVGVRFTMTQENERHLEPLIDLCEAERFPKFYLSHLVYAGRGNKNRGRDSEWASTRRAMDLMIARAVRAIDEGRDLEIVTGNNDADAVYLLHWVRAHHPDQAERLERMLVRWGGNASGVNVANIDNLGQVHPDTMWWHHTLGNVKERAFSDIWTDLSDPVFAGLKQRPRAVTGRCGACAHLAICGGNTRIRALKVTGDPWAEDPGCYLSDAEIGLDNAAPRITVTPFRGVSHEASV
ncbi:MAG TPA: heme d1 biosynthesis radical SAM protein NirJ [Beijerinckiaceae bacterium]|nr:heme d1 biosynthesis radical SAM protein NirJ [Beijerinckiaceae bacterium]